MVGSLLAYRLMIPGHSFWASLFPYALAPMIIAALLNTQLALVIAAIISVLFAYAAGNTLEFSPLEILVMSLIGGITGLLTAVTLEFGPSWFIYPLVVHGKPVDWRTVPAFFPIMFELTVLFSAFTAFFALLIMNGLPRWYHPVFNWARFSRATNDGFFLIIEARDPRFTELEARELLEQSGGTHVTIIHEEGEK